MGEKEIKWTIQGQRGEARFSVQEFKTKRAAVNAMEAVRQPKTQVNRKGRHYSFTVKD